MLLAGPTGTPYAAGVWRLHLDIPTNYPTAPPTATFRTRLWHPNIDENTGAVCVETLKRDWSSSLKLRDVLVTISCLLIQPNPASALNEAAGKLASEDWDGFCRRAKLMTQIHAGIPESMAKEVKEAQMRGEELDKQERSEDEVAKRKGKARVSADGVPAATESSMAEDEENRRRRGDTVEVESDPESDWIPGPTKLPKSFDTGRDVFGIKLLHSPAHFETPQKSRHTAKRNIPELTQSPELQPSNSFTVRVPATSTPSKSSTDSEVTSVHPNKGATPERKPKANRLLPEFSWSWQDTQILHSTGFASNGMTKTDVLKRMAGSDFQEQQEWECKRFKQAGYDLDRYNRGDWGPRTGIFRL